ncbi:hypothetical protein BH09PSE6_BH09PSE6_33390 [soil metagenome]
MKTAAKIVAVVAALMLVGCVLATWYGLGAWGGYSFSVDDTSFTIGDFTPFERIAIGVGIFFAVIGLLIASLVAMVLGLLASVLGVACGLLTVVLVLALVFSPVILIGVAIWAIVRKTQPPPRPPSAGAPITGAAR